MKEKVYMNKRTGELYVYFYWKLGEGYYYQVSECAYYNTSLFMDTNMDELEYLGEL